MKILYVASEALPFVASGGLADVAGSLPRALRNRHEACRVVLPLYGSIKPELREKMTFLTNFNVPLAWRNQYCGVFEATVNGVKYYFLDNEYYFKRDGIYGFYDDAERFAFFSRAVVEMLCHIDFEPDIIHANDWQSALVPVYLNLFYRHIEKLSRVKTVFTIHNIQYQGKYGMELTQDVLGLPVGAEPIVEYDGCVNFMKGAIEQCDAVTTVSPTYADEIQDPWYAHGLDRFLRAKSYKLHGILNGIDIALYNPETDPALKAPFDAHSPEGKQEDKLALQEELGLETGTNAMLLGMVTRLVSHKGLDLVRYVFDEIVARNIQVAVLGSGDWMYEQFFQDMQMRYPGRVAVRIGFIPELARRIYAGSDTFLMPSKSEPCGLSQMVALRYGSIPIVRETGGLKDSIRDLGGEDGNGYTFKTYNAHDMFGAICRAQGDYLAPGVWPGIVKRGMGCDFSWSRSAAEYVKLYQSLMG